MGLNEKDLVVIAVDVGVGDTRFAFAIKTDDKKEVRKLEFKNRRKEHCWPNHLLQLLRNLLDEKRKIALGFEAPLFIPIPKGKDPRRLMIREFEYVDAPRHSKKQGKRPWYAQAGSTAAMEGLAWYCWLFDILTDEYPQLRITFSWDKFLTGNCDIFIWEAFVSGGDKKSRSCDHHFRDAENAAEEFWKKIEANLKDPNFTYRPSKESNGNENQNNEYLNLVAVALWYAGYEYACKMLKEPCVVVKAPKAK